MYTNVPKNIIIEICVFEEGHRYRSKYIYLVIKLVSYPKKT